MATNLKVWRQIEYPTPSIDAFDSKKIPAKFHPDPIWNDGALGFLKRSSQQQQEQQDE